ncbi:hypothetical protein C6W22_03025 [Bacillus atrophaeus]|uniref:hypothetical protein n=1 Tax=Bacillus atrophaeus TaxID=1452 RepID=UPI0003313B4E|nr:hypothetical protein [Bacillus atrophaeus]AKL84697.1 hypothetical protein D068_cds20350 [Bacillus atrophaeus UCMB-5137]PRS09797.1 hypothetical protein C6W22_03025 [Bacillus atrophaeus]
MKVLVIKTDIPLDGEAKEKMRKEVKRVIETGVVVLDPGVDLTTVEVDEVHDINEYATTVTGVDAAIPKRRF